MAEQALEIAAKNNFRAQHAWALKDMGNIALLPVIRGWDVRSIGGIKEKRSAAETADL